jgi:hypothetical protein
MPSKADFERADSKTRATHAARPSNYERGLEIRDEDALTRWARRRGGALDFVPNPDTHPVRDPSYFEQWAKKRGAALDFTPQPVTAKRQPPFKQRRGIGWDPQPEPPSIVQHGNNDCWAVALLSWARAAKAKKRPTYDELSREYGKEIKKGIDIPKLRHIVKAFGMKTDWFTRDQMTRAKVISLLAQHGPLFIGRYHSEGRLQPWWHALVLYDLTPDLRGMYMVMNPAREQDPIDALTMDALFHGNDELLVGFKDDAGKR